MGTSASVKVNDEHGNILVNMYVQSDGYPTGFGRDLAEFLSGSEMINGISGDETHRVFNGIDCLAAQLVAHFKTSVGGFYLVPYYSVYSYNYDIFYSHVAVGELSIIVTNMDDEILFEGSVEEYVMWTKGNN